MKALHMHPLHPSRSGFTFIEVLIVLAISITILGIGAIYLGGFRTGQRIEIETKQITTLLESAQEKSRSQENDARWGVYLNNASDRGTYSLYQVDEATLLLGDTGTEPGTVSIQRTLPVDVSFTTPATTETLNIIFSLGTGLPSIGTSVSLSTRGTSDTRTITVGANGQIEYQ